MRPYYSEYIRHAMRYYVKTADNGDVPVFRTEADRANWNACQHTVQEMTEHERGILFTLYRLERITPEDVKQIAEAYNVRHGKVWDMVKDFERKAARNRGLV